MQVVERLWFTRNEAASLCGLSSRQFDDVVRPRIDKASVRGAGKTLRFAGPGCVAALVEYRLESAKPTAPEDVDPLMGGPPSDWLEEYRKVNTELRRRDLAERDGTLVRPEVVRQAMRSGVSAMRGTGDRLVRQFGNEAGEIYNEGVTEFEAAALRVVNDAGGSHPDKQPDGVPADPAASDA